MGTPRVLGIAAIVAVTVGVAGTASWRGPEPKADWRSRFTQAALQIPFDSDRAPERDSALSKEIRIPEGLLRLRIAAARTRDTGRTARIAFRITSDTAYPRLGIAQGANYVWTDVVRGKTRRIMIPADTGKPAYWLDVQVHEHTKAPRLPRLILAMQGDRTTSGRKTSSTRLMALGCDGCKDNPLVWCSSRDTTHRLALVQVPINAINAYFSRNHVAFAQR